MSQIWKGFNWECWTNPWKSNTLCPRFWARSLVQIRLTRTTALKRGADGFPVSTFTYRPADWGFPVRGIFVLRSYIRMEWLVCNYGTVVIGGDFILLNEHFITLKQNLISRKCKRSVDQNFDRPTAWRMRYFLIFCTDIWHSNQFVF